ncbi:MAG: hypothetical protein FJ398_16455 [Verrucomicrobia bacterium]|nr:hypothetical protein [Verrucomicrobiota bacterium]
MKRILVSRCSFLTILARLCAIATCLTLNGQGRAQDNQKSDVTGTWKWTQRRPNGQPFETTLKLKQQGDKITGVQLGRGGEVNIRDGIIREGKLSFKVVLDFGGGERIIKYEGALKDDTIEGKIESDFGGGPPVRPWLAKREIAKPKPAMNVTGTWQWTFTTPGGQTFEPRVRLAQTGERLTGTVFWGEGEAAISDASVEDEQVSFKVVRERAGRSVTTQYRGKLAGDTIVGKIESDWSGNVQTFDWNARKVGAQANASP